MALYRWGVLSAKRSIKFYSTMVIVGLLVGLPFIGVGVWQKSINGWDPVRQHFIDGNWNIVGALFVACAWIGLVMLVCKNQWFPFARKALAAVGRMALTNYIGQSLICYLSLLWTWVRLVWASWQSTTPGNRRRDLDFPNHF